nr:PREDICTED: uncharacterized protein LOC109043220 [Bemisia tabaci]XP_018915900.1 PREDICTED: uncharacterized protein LOC109043220 [Bemisia tabaci]
MSPQVLKRSCVKIITLGGRPLECMDDEGFHDIIGPIIDAMPAHKQFAISAGTVKRMIPDEATQLVMNLRSELARRFVCLKVDAVSRLHRSFLGINVQFIENAQVCIRTLAVTEITKKHTGENMKEMVLECLKKYGVDLKHVYTFTTDNGSNMIKTGRLLQVLQEKNYISEVDAEMTQYLEDFFEGLEFDIDSAGSILSSVPCAAHTLQLAVLEFLKEEINKTILERARQEVRTLRTQNLVLKLKELKLPIPTLDCITRWHSTDDMLASLLKLKPFSEQLQIKLTEAEWKEIEELHKTLEPAKIATKVFEEEQLLIGDFVAYWMRMKGKIKKLNTPYADKLVSYIEARERIPAANRDTPLMKNPAVVAALYLDPRYFNVLSEDDVKLAENHILKLYARMCEEEPRQPSQEVQEVFSDEEEDEFRAMLIEKERERTIRPSPKKRGKVALDMELDLYDFRSRIKMVHRKTNILEWWQTEGYRKWPRLLAIANIVLAVPATQVSVERLFSGLKYIFSKSRSNIGSELLEAITVIRSNSKFMERYVVPECAIDRRSSAESASDESFNSSVSSS